MGTGFGTHAHVPAFRSVEGCEVLAVCSGHPERALAAADRLCIPRPYGDWQSLVDDPDLDIVTVALPPRLQPVVAMAALERGKAVFCEKPLAASLEDAVAMAEAAGRSGLPNMVDFEFPEIPCWIRAKSLLDGGEIGPLRHVAVTWNLESRASLNATVSWKSQGVAGGGALRSLVSHVFHYVEWYAGLIDCVASDLRCAPGDVRPHDTLAMLRLTLRSGVPVTVTACSHAVAGTVHRLEFYGADGNLTLENDTGDPAHGFKLSTGTRGGGCRRIVESDPQASTLEDDGRIVAVSRLAARFVDWFRTGKSARPDFADGLRVQSLLDAALRSHERGGLAEAPVLPAIQSHGG